MTAFAYSDEVAKPTSPSDLQAILRRLKEAALKKSAPTYEERIASLEKLERALVSRKEAIARAISRDFGNRSKHETLAAELFVLLGAIKHTKAHLRDWMDPEDRETSWVFLPATSQVIHQPLGVIGIIAPWNYPVQLALEYAMVQSGMRGPFVEACKAAVGKMYPTLEKNPDYATIINDNHYARVRSYVDNAKSRGAKVIEINPAGETLDAGSRKMAPTLVLDATDDMLCLQEEIFGPVLPIRTYEKPEDAIGYVNLHPRPLALYYFGNDRAQIDRVLYETISGGVTVNDAMLHFAQDDLPFGGVGPSGMGQYHAQEGFETFSKKKAVFLQSRINTTV